MLGKVRLGSRLMGGGDGGWRNGGLGWLGWVGLGFEYGRVDDEKKRRPCD